ncbi:MAG: quinolinate synthase NadA [Candidatus Firestonebacteria bacterium]|nr:quinolinate synthase NadA [Candidatus Firestonebacteria bacterium]
MENKKLQEKIVILKNKLNAVLIAHNYQREEIQQIADHLGDSLALSRAAAGTQADIIVFCGVHFMAETANILSPHKTVLLPEKDAGCPLADMLSLEQLLDLKVKHPKAKVVCYINSPASIKAESDICCTSSNAVSVIKSLPKDEEIIFVPDMNLGQYVSKVTGRKLILWNGYCPTHHRITLEDVNNIKKIHPEAPVFSHPECTPEILEISDKILSTGGMLTAAAESKEKNIIIVTEIGMLYRLRRDNPDKNFFIASKKLICPNMKLTTLESILESLEKMQYIISVPEEIRIKAQKAINRMLSF